MKKRILSILLGLFLLGCSDDNNNNSPSTDKLLPSKIYCTTYSPRIEYDFLYELKYDSQNRIRSIKTTFIDKKNPQNKNVFKTSFLYDKNTITQTTTGKDLHEEIIYKKEENRIHIGGDIKYPYYIAIDAQGRPTEFNYDANGNPLSAEFDEVDFDTKNGVFLHINMPLWYLTKQMPMWYWAKQSTLLSKSHHVFNNTLNTVYRRVAGFQYIYEYNIVNYPVKISFKPHGFAGYEAEDCEIEYIDAN